MAGIISLRKIISSLAGTPVDFDQAPTVNGLGLRTKRNMIVNGAMMVSQENGDGPNFVTDNVAFFVADQFDSFETATVGMDTTASIVDLENSRAAKLEVTAVSGVDFTGANQSGRLRQKFEAQNVKHLNGQDVTISFKINTNWSGEFPISILNSDESRSYVTTATLAIGVNKVSVTIPFESDTVSNSGTDTGFSLILGTCNEGNFQTGTKGVWQAGNFRTSTDSETWCNTLGNFVEITQVQLEEGDVATPFEHQKYSEVLAECQRYFIDLLGTKYVVNTPVASGVCFNANTTYIVVGGFEMRASPEVSKSSSGHFTVLEASGTHVVTNLRRASTSVSNRVVEILADANPGDFVGGNAAWLRTNSTSGRLFLDARL